MTPILTPAQTYQKLVRGETERLRFADMAGRIAAVMLVPYPPGIPMSMPGERLGGPNTPVIKLILAMEEFGKRFPGFERETHGIEVDADGNYWMRGVIENGVSAEQPPQPSDPALATRSTAAKTPRKRRKSPGPGSSPPHEEASPTKPVRRSTE